MRNLPSRVARLEKVVQSRPPAPCPECGTPRGWVAGFVIRDPEGNPLNAEYCPKCGTETIGGTTMNLIDPVRGGYCDVLVLPAGSAPLPV